MKLSIRSKLTVGFAFIVISLIAVCCISFYALKTVGATSDVIYQNSNENYLWQQWKAFLERETVYYMTFSLNQDSHYLEEAHARAKDAGQVQRELAAMVSDDRKEILENLLDKSALVAQLGEATAEAVASGDIETATRTIKNWETLDNELIAGIDQCIEVSKQSTNTALTTSGNTKTNLIMIMIIGSVFSILLAVIIEMLLSRSISRGIITVKKALQKMAAGDLTHKVIIKSSDETGDMAKAYNEMQQYLNNLVGQFKQSAVQLSSASDQLAVAAKQSSDSTQQVATSSQQMAKGAQEQSSNAQETSRSITQLSEAIGHLASGASEQASGVQKAVSSITSVANTISQVADNASQAAQGAKLAAESAQNGAEMSKLTLSGMEKIKSAAGDTAKKIDELGARSTEIGKIVAVIDDIAAQTNLLALNAAIEAARAGDQGRGFAVVSDEVRKLAERTATATKEIAELIASVQKGVNEANQVMAAGSSAVAEGFNMAVKSGQSLQQILKTVSEVNVQVDQISSRTQQVNTATNDLVKIIDSVGKVTEQNTATTEQMSASAIQVSKSIETVAGIAEENSAATEQVSASAQEMSAQVQEIVASAQTLKEMAATLEQSVAMFKVENTAK